MYAAVNKAATLVLINQSSGFGETTIFQVTLETFTVTDTDSLES